MDKIAHFKDEEFPFTYIDHTRIISRAIIINDHNEIFLEYVTRDDLFGNASYYETPGGGVNDGESLSEGCLREIQEECGLVCQIIDEIGYIEDDYNAIHRHNISHYYLVKAIDTCEKRQEEYEKLWFSKMEYVPLDKAIEILSKPDSKIARIVYKRELEILLKVKKMMEK